MQSKEEKKQMQELGKYFLSMAWLQRKETIARTWKIFSKYGVVAKKRRGKKPLKKSGNIF